LVSCSASAGQSDSSRFGFTFDWELRYTQLIESIGSADVDPTVSILTPGLGFITGVGDDPESRSRFRIGVRPEFVLSPHDDEDDFGNSVDLDWVVPEFLAEYQRNKVTLGVAYKNYHISAEDFRGFEADLANLSTVSVYVKFSYLLLGYNFVSVDDEGLLGETTDIETGNFLVGLVVPF
jgi:hypothetical protein